jgi:hypothetical protein
MSNDTRFTVMCVLPVLLTLGVSSVFGQTNTAGKSTVGTWRLDVAKSDFGSQPAPKSVTLTILKDAPEMSSWQVTGVDAKGESFFFSWTGPMDGSMQPLKGPKGEELGKESLRLDTDGALLRHGVGTDGSSFDARGTVSEDGNTITETGTEKSKDGKISKGTSVYRRAASASSGAPK